MIRLRVVYLFFCLVLRQMSDVRLPSTQEQTKSYLCFNNCASIERKIDFNLLMELLEYY